MSAKIKYEDLTPDMQELYKKENRLRKIWLIIGLIAGVLMGIFSVNTTTKANGNIDASQIVVAVVFGWMMSAIIVGAVHQRRWFSKIRHSMPLIPIGLVVMYLALIPAGWLGYGLVPIDIVRFIIRKPLIFNSEIPAILNMRQTN